MAFLFILKEMHSSLRNHIERVVDLSDQEFGYLLAHFENADFGKGDLIFQKGEQVVRAYYIVSGLVKLIYHDENVNEHIVSFAMEDWWESDFNAFFNRSTANYTLKCLEATKAYYISIEGYEKICKEMPKIQPFWFQKAIGGFASSQRRILSLLTNSPKVRYEQFLKDYPTLSQRVSKTQIAAYLGVSRETLSRIYS